MKKKKENKQVIELLDKKNKVSMAISISWMVAGTLLQAVPYFLIYNLIKTVLLSAYEGRSLDTGLIMALGFGMVVAVLLGMAGIAIGGVKIHKTAYDILLNFRNQVSDHMMKVNLGFFNKHASGKIQKVIGENIEAMENFIAHMLPNVINGGILLIVLLTFMFYLNVWLTLAVLGFIIIAFSLQAAVMGGKNVRSLMDDINQLNTNISVGFNETINGIEEIKMFQTADRQMTSLSRGIDDYLLFAVRFLKKITPIYEGYKAIITSLVPCLFPFIYLVLKASSDVTVVINCMMFIIVTPAIYPTILELVEMGSDYLNVDLKMKEINELLTYETLDESQSPRVPSCYDISFKGVSFAYGDKPVINDLSLDIPEGSMTALIGASGCGKSTLGYLLMRFFDVNDGKVEIGGVAINQMTNKTLMACISYVSQETYLFNGSVLDNITMGKDLPMVGIAAICEKAQCLEMIKDLPEGFDTIIGQNGHALSGGQAQRIGIARAMVKDAPILILDEPMASADTENEHLITRALSDLSKDKTVITIAHRLKSIAHADQIVVLDNGKIKEAGRHQDLMKQDSIYSYYYSMQQSIDKWHIKKGVINV